MTDFLWLADAVWFLALLPVFSFSLYLLWLTIGAWRLSAPKPRTPTTRFTYIVPSHNEEVGIEATVRSLESVDYPESLRRVWVIADNCKDRTAELARKAGAHVIERFSEDKRGKGYALELAFEKILEDDFSDAVVVVDADTLVTKNILTAFDARFAAGAGAVQAEYGVSNPLASWRTRLMTIALALFHVLRSLARERRGLSAGLRGNGMGFSRQTLAKVPHNAFSIVEDLEYGIRLGRQGIRVQFVHEARVLGEMVSGEAASRSQRRRWEQGRLQMAKSHGFPLLKEALAKGDRLLFDLAMDVLVPPITFIAAPLLASSVLIAVLGFGFGMMFPLSGATTSLGLLFFLLYITRGVMLSGVGWRGVLDMGWAPVYMVWKLTLPLRRDDKKKGEWVRTARESSSKDQSESQEPK